mmetsp:Transcript_18916/g.60754  ORF Transcript_18916/g.60754 Transcript_18916/m.60754 type:complete len:338 (-) Transcript_18916:11-1024(-)
MFALWRALALALLVGRVASECRDMHDRCRAWARQGECSANPAFMHGSCAASCDTCGEMRRDCGELGPDALSEGGITEAMERMLSLEGYGGRILSRDPWVILLETFLDKDEVAMVIRVGGHNFSRSLAGAGSGFVSARTSSTSWCNVPKCERDPDMLALKHKITGAIGSCPMANTEHLQVLRYEPGQYYRSHHDQNSPHESPSGPRIFTFFIQLSHVPKGGETHFPRLGLTVEPKPGQAIVWASVRDDDVYADDPRTEHEARSVEEGVKYAANFWTHLRDFQTPHAAGCSPSAVPSGTARRKEGRRRAEEWRAARSGEGGWERGDDGGGDSGSLQVEL